MNSVDLSGPDPAPDRGRVVTERVCTELADTLKYDRADITPETLLEALPLDSVEAVRLSAQISEWAGVTFAPTLLYEFDTIADLCAHIALLSPEREPDAATQEFVLPIAIAASFTFEPVAEALSYLLAAVRIPAEITFAPYNQVFQELLNPQSLLAGNTNGINIVAFRIEDWYRFDAPAATDQAHRRVDEFIAALSAAAPRLTSPLLLALCPHSPAAVAAAGIEAEIERLDARVQTAAAALPNVEVIDLRRIETQYAVNGVLDPARDEVGHIPFTTTCYAAIGQELARRIFRCAHAPFKVLAVDCDNTLWGGAAAEEGPEGVTLDASHLALQRFLAEQQQSGRLLCLVSKNAEADVWAVFDRRPEMILQRTHIVAARIDWEPKSANLRALAIELGLGVDSMVFLDDNPVECAEVQAGVPEALVVPLPAPDSDWAGYLMHHWAFDQGSVTEEDRRRTELYAEERQRKSVLESAGDYEQFLCDLNVEVTIAPLAAEDLPRSVQLTERTNQFNSTTIRRSEGEMQRLLASPLPRVFTVRARDRFGDYGLIGLATVGDEEQTGDVLEVESLLMSCRVLGKRVEQEIVRYLAAVALARGKSLVRFLYRPTERNLPIQRFFASLAASRTDADDASTAFSFPAEEVERVLTTQEPIVYTLEPDAASPSPAGNSVTATNAGALRDYSRIAPGLTQIAGYRGDSSALLATIRASTVHRPELSTPFVSPRTPLQKQIADIWRDCLGIDRIGIYDSFFDLGGDSLRGAEVLARLFEIGVPDTISLGIMNDPTVAGLAHAVDQLRQGKRLTTSSYLASLEDEARLPADIRVVAPLRLSDRLETIFLTGATGYVGAYLTYELLETTSARLICHVRASNEEAAYERLCRNLERYGLWNDSYHTRIDAVTGDLSAPLLGMSPDRYEQLAHETDSVVHNGAWVNFIFPYSYLKPANVDGTLHALRFALHGATKPFHFISTLGVLMSGGYGRDRILFEGEALDHSEDLPNGYEQTKWVADQLVARAMQQGVPASIYRLGMVSGLSACGTYHKLSEFLPAFLKGCVQLGSFPEIDSKIEMVPVDFVTRAAARIIANPDSLGRVYHMNHPNAITDADFAGWIRDYGYPLRSVPWDVWKRELMGSGSRLRDNALYPFLDFLRGLEAHQTYIPEMDMTNFLGAAGIDASACHDQWTLLARYFDYFIREKWLEAPEPR